MKKITIIIACVLIMILVGGCKNTQEDIKNTTEEVDIIKEETSEKMTEETKEPIDESTNNSKLEVLTMDVFENLFLGKDILIEESTNAPWEKPIEILLPKKEFFTTETIGRVQSDLGYFFFQVDASTGNLPVSYFSSEEIEKIGNYYFIKDSEKICEQSVNVIYIIIDENDIALTINILGVTRDVAEEKYPGENISFMTSEYISSVEEIIKNSLE